LFEKRILEDLEQLILAYLFGLYIFKVSFLEHRQDRVKGVLVQLAVGRYRLINQAEKILRKSSCERKRGVLGLVSPWLFLNSNGYHVSIPVKKLLLIVGYCLVLINHVHYRVKVDIQCTQILGGCAFRGDLL
jgi:hypothetical protein